MALSEELGGFIEYVGGSDWGHVLLSPLENLAAIEEPVVRDKVCIIAALVISDSSLIVGTRLSNLLTGSVISSLLNRSKSTLSHLLSDFRKPTGSLRRSQDVACSRAHTRRSPRLFKNNCAVSSAFWYTTRRLWFGDSPPPTWPSLSRRCPLLL